MCTTARKLYLDNGQKSFHMNGSLISHELIILKKRKQQENEDIWSDVISPGIEILELERILTQIMVGCAGIYWDSVIGEP